MLLGLYFVRRSSVSGRWTKVTFVKKHFSLAACEFLATLLQTRTKVLAEGQVVPVWLVLWKARGLRRRTPKRHQVRHDKGRDGDRFALANGRDFGGLHIDICTAVEDRQGHRGWMGARADGDHASAKVSNFHGLATMHDRRPRKAFLLYGPILWTSRESAESDSLANKYQYINYCKLNLLSGIRCSRKFLLRSARSAQGRNLLRIARKESSS